MRAGPSLPGSGPLSMTPPGACGPSVRAICGGWSVAAGLPEPEWGAAIETPAGVYFVDAFWRRKCVAVEADGRAYHLNAADWEADLRRQNAIHGAGVVLLRYPVVRLRSDGAACGDEMRRLIA